MSVLFGQENASVRDISISGNSYLSSKEITNHLRLSKSRWFIKPVYDRRVLKLDAITVKNLYISHGFLSVIVTDSIFVEEDNIDIHFTINEGNQYFIRDIHVEGNTLIPTQKILDILQFKRNEPYDPVTANNRLSTLEAEHHQYGKLYARVQIEDFIQDSVDIFIRIHEGIDVGVKGYYIEGVEPINPRIVEREIAFESGTLYQRSLIDKTQKRIKETGVFSLVSLSPIRIAQTDSLVNILIELRQFKTREWISEGGFFPVEYNEGVEPIPGLGGDIEWRNRSLFHTSTNFSAKLSGHFPIGQELYYPKFRYDMQFGNQWILNVWRIPTTVGLYYETLRNYSLTNANIHRYGFQIENHIRFLNRSYFLSTLSWDKNIIPEGASFGDKGLDIEQRSVECRVHLDRANHPIYPSRGYKIDGELRQTGGPVLGGNREYFKYDFGLNTYIPIFGKLVLASRVKYGMMFGWKQSYTDENKDKFYLGGSTTMRGWDTFRFKTETAANGTDILEYGDVVRFLTNWELRFPLFWLLGIELFLDGGILTDHFSKVTYSTIEWNHGVGITVDTPLGPARLDYAVPLEGNKRGMIQLGVQYIF